MCFYINIMPSPEDMVQWNLRIPTELLGNLKTLAKDAGQKPHPYILGVILEGAKKHLAEIDRETFMANLAEEHQAEVDFYTKRFDDIEHHGL
jgi:hypothetical protein